MKFFLNMQKKKKKSWGLEKSDVWNWRSLIVPLTYLLNWLSFALAWENKYQKRQVDKIVFIRLWLKHPVHYPQWGVCGYRLSWDSTLHWSWYPQPIHKPMLIIQLTLEICKFSRFPGQLPLNSSSFLVTLFFTGVLCCEYTLYFLFLVPSKS